MTSKLPRLEIEIPPDKVPVMLGILEDIAAEEPSFATGTRRQVLQDLIFAMKGLNRPSPGGSSFARVQSGDIVIQVRSSARTEGLHGMGEWRIATKGKDGYLIEFAPRPPELPDVVIAFKVASRADPAINLTVCLQQSAESAGTLHVFLTDPAHWCVLRDGVSAALAELPDRLLASEDTELALQRLDEEIDAALE